MVIAVGVGAGAVGTGAVWLLDRSRFYTNRSRNGSGRRAGILSKSSRSCCPVVLVGSGFSRGCAEVQSWWVVQSPEVQRYSSVVVELCRGELCRWCRCCAGALRWC